MAELVLASLINETVELAASLIGQEASRLAGLRSDIEWLLRQFNLMQSYLEDAQQKEAENHRVATLIKDIEELALDVEDLFDTYRPQLQSPEGQGRFRWQKKSACIFSCGHEARQFAMEIENIKTRVQEIDDNRKTYGITDTTTDGTREENIHDSTTDGSREENIHDTTTDGTREENIHDSTTDGFCEENIHDGTTDGSREENIHDGMSRRLFFGADEPEIIVRGKYANKLEAKLLEPRVDYGVISIVGMPGMGKTTLAKRIFNRVKDRFDCSAMEFVSQVPQVKQLLQRIATQVGVAEKLKDRQQKQLEDLQLEDLQYELRSILKEEKYVILLDDIWTTDAWDDLKLIFPTHPKTGSRLIITSRNSSVGRYIGGESSLHELHPLKTEDCMRLFWKSVMAHEEDTNYSPDLINIGGKIAKKCGGMPLAIVVMAGILRKRKRNKRQWDLVLKGMGHNEEEEERLRRIIALSYKDLPSKLKPCFLYLGLYPEDYVIPASTLIKMWVAEKFIGANVGPMEIEEVGEEYLNDLVARNLVQVVGIGLEGRIKSCRIHDVLHSFCINVAEKNNFFQTLDNVERMKRSDPISVIKVRRVTTHFRSVDEYVALNPQMPKLRALLCFKRINHKLDEQHRRIFFGEHRFLRVLLVDFVPFAGVIPKRIRKMRQLRCLQGGGLKADSSCFKKLENLQSIDFPYRLIVGSNHIWKMEQLRHMGIVHGVFSPPTEVFLPNLQTLDIWDLRWHPKMLVIFKNLPSLRRLKVRGYDLAFMIEALSGGTPMMHKIEILKLEEILSAPEAGRVNLSSYLNLVELRLRVKLNKLPNPDEFPPNLIKLTLIASQLREDPMKTLGSLPNLKLLKLGSNSYAGSSMHCSGTGSFRNLKLLMLRNLNDLEEMMVDDGALSELKVLVIKNCPALNNILPRLQHIAKYVPPTRRTHMSQLVQL